MTVTVYIYANNGMSIEIPDDAEAPLASNNSRLSSEEFKAILDRLAAKAMKFDGPDAEPLSDYAMSRENIYENHPKL
ncbi:hypothetical protein C6503_00840 [Candidatus Poribacteria bacterium]|nr:MAG: hypothetical protein C6503_00840 [Candidatus Poribacteria bacterium]